MKTVLAILVLVAAAAGGWFAGQRQAPAPVVAERAAAPPLTQGVGALGRVEPRSRIRRLNQPGGMSVTRLARLLVVEGEEVRQGQILAEFADTGLKDAEVMRAEAALAEQRASLDRTRAAGRPSEIEAQQARIAGLTSLEEIARRDASRTDRLVPSGAGAEAVAERNRFNVTRAAADRRQAVADLETLAAPRPEDVALAEARVANAEAALAKAIADAALSRLAAPIAGTVLRIFARPGDQVTNADGLMELADLSQMDVVADVYETDIPRLTLGMNAEIIIPGETRRYGATLREIGLSVRRTTQAGTDPVAAVDARTVEVRLTLHDEARALLARRSNMQVQVAMRAGPAAAAADRPAAAAADRPGAAAADRPAAAAADRPAAAAADRSSAAAR